jgi:hypothetical protein
MADQGSPGAPVTAPLFAQGQRPCTLWWTSAQNKTSCRVSRGRSAGLRTPRQQARRRGKVPPPQPAHAVPQVPVDGGSRPLVRAGDAVRSGPAAGTRVAGFRPGDDLVLVNRQQAVGKPPAPLAGEQAGEGVATGQPALAPAQGVVEVHLRLARGAVDLPVGAGRPAAGAVEVGVGLGQNGDQDQRRSAKRRHNVYSSWSRSGRRRECAFQNAPTGFAQARPAAC